MSIVTGETPEHILMIVNRLTDIMRDIDTVEVVGEASVILKNANKTLIGVTTDLLKAYGETRNLENTDTAKYGLTKEEIHLIHTGGSTIPAIKAVRERTHLGLKEAKELVDKYKREKGLGPPDTY